MSLSDANTWAGVIGCPLTDNNNSRPSLGPPRVPGSVPHTYVPRSRHPTPPRRWGSFPFTDEETEARGVSIRRLVTYDY